MTGGPARIDQLLVQRALASTRSQAQRLIADGVEWQTAVRSSWKRVAKNGDEVPEDAAIRLLDDAEARYVSRGGLKLEAALAVVGLSVKGLRCLDVGQSTGGFTDCLLQAGAASVVGVDVGSAQLHANLRQDARVLCVEGVNARNLTAADLQTAYSSSMGAGGPFEPDTGDSAASDPSVDDSVDLPAEFAPPFDLLVADCHSFRKRWCCLPPWRCCAQAEPC